MLSGLADSLTRADFRDLVKFLARLSRGEVAGVPFTTPSQSAAVGTAAGRATELQALVGTWTGTMTETMGCDICGAR